MFTRFCQKLWPILAALIPFSANTTPVVEENFRGPVRLQLDAESNTLWVFQSKTGAISRIDTSSGSLVAEYSSGGSAISDGRLTKNGWILCLDPKASMLRLLQAGEIADESSIESNLHEVSVPTDPARMELNQAQDQIAIASRWSRTLSLWSLQESSDLINHLPKPEIEKTGELHLDFAPGEMAYFEEESILFVADFFGGTIAAVDLQTLEIKSSLELPANNIGDLYLDRSGDDPQVWLTSESLNPIATTFSTEVQWGVMMGNHMRRLSAIRLLEPTNISNAKSLGEVASLGDETGPGGDPGRMAFTTDGKAIVCLSGVNRVALREISNRNYIPRVEVGERPMDVVLAPDEKSVYVANYFSDTIVQVDLQYLEALRTISLGPQPDPDLVAKGERLFFNATLSPRGWYSCHSCHTEGHTNGSLNDNLGDDSFGAPKKVLSLLGVGHTAPYAWLGSQEELEGQIVKTLKNTMLNRDVPEDRVKALAAYLKTLAPPPSLLEARGQLEAAHVERGRVVFESSKCNRCHEAPLYTTPKSYDVGLVDAVGNDSFNPPSLLSVSQKTTFLHDNSASTLKEVFLKRNHPKQRNWNEADLDDLVYFLKSL